MYIGITGSTFYINCDTAQSNHQRLSIELSRTMKKSLSSACLVWLLRFAVPTEALRRPIRTSVAMGISRGGSSYPDSSSYPMDDGVTFPHDQESVQDRVNAWKRQQMVRRVAALSDVGFMGIYGHYEVLLALALCIDPMQPAEM